MIQSDALELRKFAIHHCIENTCFRATGDEGYVGHIKDFFSASHVRLELVDGRGVRQKTFRCSSFNFDLSSELLICDNTSANETSLAIDKSSGLRKY